MPLSKDSLDKLKRLSADFDSDDVINWAYAAADEIDEIIAQETGCT